MQVISYDRLFAIRKKTTIVSLFANMRGGANRLFLQEITDQNIPVFLRSFVIHERPQR